MNIVEEKIKKIVTLIINYVDPQKVILFGSRAEGQEYKGLDIDIAFEGCNITSREFRKLKESVDEARRLYSVDIIVLEKTDKAFQNIVKETGTTLYEKSDLYVAFNK
ncbi:MAG: nucleotidyltransferase domain-containing protein [Spirochaetota bacterium]